MSKPLISINNFANMGDDGLFYLEGMETKKINGKKILTSSWYHSESANKDDTGFSNLGDISGMTNVSYLDDSRIVGIADYRLFDIDPFSAPGIGEIHSFSASSLNIKADVLTTNNGSILYSNKSHCGIAYTGICDTGSGATSIVDSAGRNLSNLGIGTSAGQNKVYNLTKQEEFTITGIGTEVSTNDKMTFNSGTNTNEAGDHFIVFADFFFDLSDTGVTAPQFSGQISELYWSRQIFEFENNYYVLNGNYIAQISGDETTVDNDIQQLPYLTQATCARVNNDSVLIGGEKQGKGVLLLTNSEYLEDSTINSWLSKLELDRPPGCIVAYKSGWVVNVGATFYYTDGYQLEEITSLLDSDNPSLGFSLEHSSMVVLRGKLVVVNNSNGYTRLKRGVFVYDFTHGWTYVPIKYNNTYPQNETIGCVALAHNVVNGTSFPRIVTSFESAINILNNTGFASRKTATFFIDLVNKTQISKITLNLAHKIDKLSEPETTSSVTISIGDGDGAYWGLGQVGSGATTTSIPNTIGQYYRKKVGSKITVTEGDYAGEVSYITAIDNEGESNETWTISPALSGQLSSGTDITIENINKVKTINVNTYNLLNGGGGLSFYPKMVITDKLFLEVRIDSTEKLDILGINIY